MPSAYLDVQVAMVAGLIAETLKAEGDKAAKSVAYDTGKSITFTPKKDGSAVLINTDPADSGVTILERLVTITVVPGTTTIADLIAGVAGNPRVSALLEISGDAGTFPVGYADWTESLALYDAPVPPIVRGVYRRPLGANPADTVFPCLVVRRIGGPWEGTGARRKRTAEFEIGYYVGKKTAGAELDAGWGCLSTRAAQIDEALVRRWHPGFESGQNLSTLAGIEDIQIERDSYGSQLPDGTTDADYPCLTLTVRVQHADAHTCDADALSRVVVKYGLDQQPDADNEMIRSYVDP